MLASEVKKGSAEVLILGVLEQRQRHGYDIARQIETLSDGAITFNSATLYPTLHRLEQRGLITGRWVEKPGQRRRRYYQLTPEGARQLDAQRRGWREFVRAIAQITGVEYA